MSFTDLPIVMSSTGTYRSGISSTRIISSWLKPIIGQVSQPFSLAMSINCMADKEALRMASSR
ncbi:hypothetical protein D3C80_2114300 [compost metagenome]